MGKVHDDDLAHSVPHRCFASDPGGLPEVEDEDQEEFEEELLEEEFEEGELDDVFDQEMDFNGSEVSLKDFRKDIIVELHNGAGALHYKPKAFHPDFINVLG